MRAVPSLGGKKCALEKLKNERFIARERGSGTRDVLETVLREHNLDLRAFRSVSEIGSLGAIKRMVQDGCGVTFLYERAARRELQAGDLVKLDLQDFDIVREFHFVSLKGSSHAEEERFFFSFCAERLDRV